MTENNANKPHHFNGFVILGIPRIMVHMGGLRHDKGMSWFALSFAAKLFGACSLKEHCLSPRVTHRRLKRWEHKAVMERQCGSVVKHPFGTLKCWAGINYFLMRGLTKCRGELKLITLCDNFQRVLTKIKIHTFIVYCQAWMLVHGRSVLCEYFGHNGLYISVI